MTRGSVGVVIGSEVLLHLVGHAAMPTARQGLRWC
jgi:hypothetical protein